MADPGVVALDPVRLASLEAALRDGADRCGRGAGAVVTDLAGTGEAAPGAVGDLEALAGWCRVQADGVRWRRRAVEALPVALPLPAWPRGGAALARSRASVWADRLAEALAGRPPDWEVLSPVLAQVRRGLDDPAFVAGLADRLGPTALLRLGIDVERSVAAGPDVDAPEARAGRMAVEELWGRVRRPEGAEDPAWDALAAVARVPDEATAARAVAGVRALADTPAAPAPGPGVAVPRDVGLVADTASGVLGALRTLRSGGSVSVSPTAVIDLVGDLAALADDPDEIDVLSTIADGLRMVAPFLGPAAVAGFGAAAIVSFAAWAASHDLPDDDRDVRRDDRGNGARALPEREREQPGRRHGRGAAGGVRLS